MGPGSRPGRRGDRCAIEFQTQFRLLAALSARGLHQLHARRKKGAGKAGCRLHPRSCTKCTSGPQGNRVNPAFPAQWFYGLLRAHPGVPSSLAPVASGLTMQPKPGRAGRTSQDLTPDRGVRSSRLHRPRPSLLNAPRRLAARAEFWQQRLAASFVRAPDNRSRQSRPAIPCAPDAVASIASQPTVRDDSRSAPSRVRRAEL